MEIKNQANNESIKQPEWNAKAKLELLPSFFSNTHIFRKTPANMKKDLIAKDVAIRF